MLQDMWQKEKLTMWFLVSRGEIVPQNMWQKEKLAMWFLWDPGDQLVPGGSLLPCPRRDGCGTDK